MLSRARQPPELIDLRLVPRSRRGGHHDAVIVDYECELAQLEEQRAASAKAYVILDGTLLPIDRIAADRLFYSGKHKRHGMNMHP